jgi:hypothetical protein
MRHISKLYIIVLLIAAHQVKSQSSCNSCTSGISTNDTLLHIVTSVDTTSYTITTGQTFCITNTGTFRGTIIINGGTVCNKGRFFPKSLTFSSGVIFNNNNARIKTALSLGSSTTLNNNSGAVLNLNGNLGISGGTLYNEGLINVNADIQNNSGSFSNKTIINCNTLSGSNTIVNYSIGIINTKN